MIEINIFKVFANDYVTREAGELLRKMILENMAAEKITVIVLNNKMVASTSFFDEGIAKLALTKIEKEKIKQLLMFKDIHKFDVPTLLAVCKHRGLVLDKTQFK